MNPFQIVLQEKFEEMKAKNPMLSKRFFAKKIGISSGALTEILNGKRKVSKKLIQKISDQLLLSPIQQQSLKYYLNPTEFDENLDLPIEYQAVNLEQDQDYFQLISEWPHFAILNLIKSKHCQHKATWFANQLNLDLNKVEDCLDRLLRLKLIKLFNKKYYRTKK